MNPANKVWVPIICIACFCAVQALGQSSEKLLQKRVSLEVKNKRLSLVLNQITSSTNVSFSYNPNVIPTDSLVSISVRNGTVGIVLKSIFPEDRFELREISNTIIIKARDYDRRQQQKKQKYTIKGYVVDRVTGERISSATIFEISKLKSALSDHEGYYNLQLKGIEGGVQLAYSKKNYWDTIIFVAPEKETVLKVSLRPKPPNIEKIPGRKPILQEPKKRLLDVTMVKLAISENTKKNSENLIEIEEDRVAQVSFLPTWGTNRKLGGIVNNKLSLNILAGYSHGVTGLEVGGLVNVVKKNVDGVQIGGFANIVGSEVNGVQIAGFSNHGVGKVNGIQVAGFGNLVQDTIKGVQISGFSNVVIGKVNGVQIAGFTNYVTRSVDGAQVAGFLNIAEDSAGKYQIAGFGNFGKHLKGVQIAGFGNLAIGKAEGVQLAGAINITVGNIVGTQTSGLLNYAHKVKGSQFGVFNFCDTIEGAAIGIFSIVKKGYHEIELSTNELSFANFSFKTGTKKFYNIINAGIGNRSGKGFWYYGYGFGRNQHLLGTTYMDVDLTVNVLNIDQGFNDYFSLQNKLSVGLSKKIAGPLYLFVGASTSFYVYDALQPNTSTIIPGTELESRPSKYNVRNWFGYFLGIRI